MKSTSIFTVSGVAVALLGISCTVFAQEQGRVISSTPVIQQVAVPRQVCSQEQVSSPIQQKSGAGALMGGIAGGAMGHAVGNGNGRAAATVLGIFGGAILGDRIEGGQPQEQVQNVQRCSTQNFYENRAIGYNVVYEFNGKQYQVQMPQDPGPFVSLQVTPAGAQTQQPTPAMPLPAPVILPPVTQAPVFTQPVLIESSTVYVQHAPVYANPYFYHYPVVHVRAAPVIIYRPHHGYGHGRAVHVQPQHRPQHSGVRVNIAYAGQLR